MSGLFFNPSYGDHEESMVKDKYFTLFVKSTGYVLEPRVFKAPTKLWKDALQRGTILEEQPCNDPQEKTFVVADCKEIYLDHEIIRLAGRLDKPLKITSPENLNLFE